MSRMVDLFNGESCTRKFDYCLSMVHTGKNQKKKEIHFVIHSFIHCIWVPCLKTEIEDLVENIENYGENNVNAVFSFVFFDWTEKEFTSDKCAFKSLPLNFWDFFDSVIAILSIPFFTRIDVQ